MPVLVQERRTLSRPRPESMDDDFLHIGPYVELVPVPADSTDATATAIVVTLLARSERLQAIAGLARIEVNLSGRDGRPDLWLYLLPDQARQIGSALLELADAAESVR